MKGVAERGLSPLRRVRATDWKCCEMSMGISFAGESPNLIHFASGDTKALGYVSIVHERWCVSYDLQE